MLFCALPFTYAGPEATNLRSFRALVPDYSKTNGGSEPAVCPDGKTIAYRTNSGEVWILHSEKTLADPAEPWQLQLPKINLDSLNTFSTTGGIINPRSLDWSPDGKRLVIGGYAMCVAENIDYKSKTAEVRILAQPKAITEGESIGVIENPRWSPDGNKIAFIRKRDAKPGVVCVIHLDTGAETEIAHDANWSDHVWNQPWSPDSKHLAYGACHFEKENNAQAIKADGVFIVSINNRDQRKLISDKNGSSPDWSTKSNRIAFSTMREYEIKDSSGGTLGGNYSVVLITDSNGSEPKLVYQPPIPTSEQADNYDTYLDNQHITELRARFRRQFDGIIPDDIRKRLDSDQITQDEMMTFAFHIALKDIDSDLLKLLESKAKDPTGLRKVFFDPEIQEAISKLPDGKGEQLRERIFDWWTEPFINSPMPSAGIDQRPVWSPDGSKLAFIRENWFRSRECAVVILDASTKESRKVFVSHEVCHMSWTNDGTSLIAQVTRLLGQEKHTIDNSLSEITSNPEIWLIEPSLP